MNHEFNSSKSSFQHLLYYHHHRSLSNFIYLLLLEIKPTEIYFGVKYMNLTVRLISTSVIKLFQAISKILDNVFWYDKLFVDAIIRVKARYVQELRAGFVFTSLQTNYTPRPIGYLIITWSNEITLNLLINSASNDSLNQCKCLCWRKILYCVSHKTSIWTLNM